MSTLLSAQQNKEKKGRTYNIESRLQIQNNFYLTYNLMQWQWMRIYILEHSLAHTKWCDAKMEVEEKFWKMELETKT